MPKAKSKAKTFNKKPALPEDIAARLRSWMDAHARPMWTPIVERGDGTSTESKFAGVPWLGRGEHWPKCRVCEDWLPLLVQLDLDALPPKPKGTWGHGLLQVFECCKDNCQAAGCGDPTTPLTLARVVRPDASLPPPSVPKGVKRMRPKRIIGWERATDTPSFSEWDELGLRFGFETHELVCAEVGIETKVDFAAIHAWDRCSQKDKLGGWAAWVQGVSYPDCPKCKRRMDTIVFQLVSYGHLPICLGDGGRGPIVQCPVHKNVVAFAWDCG